jgi:GTP:adenosylcobinamide-phosphate guanylyltransferase
LTKHPQDEHMPGRKWAVLVLAGSRGSTDPVAEAAGVEVKALAMLAGKPMIAHVFETLAACPEIGSIAVSIEADAPPLPAASVPILRLDAGASPATSVLEATDQLGVPLLITTADNPLMTPQMVADFLRGADESGVDIAAGVSPRHVVEQAGNPGRRTYLRFRDGGYSGCNLFALRSPQGIAAIRFWRLLEADRKRPWRMASRIGLVPLVLYLSRQLSRERAAAALSARLGCRPGLVDIMHPNAAHDVDKASDLAFAESVLSRQLS